MLQTDKAEDVQSWQREASVYKMRHPNLDQLSTRGAVSTPAQGYHDSILAISIITTCIGSATAASHVSDSLAPNSTPSQPRVGSR
ncbi:hypothetical protein QC763_0096750 [Podospora pseudopauciseta]|uniref:Uncharacterized protein n=1 Tax=Podospora pseudopauciseta TaxID=2093780 RepID=A0ABR0H5U6_9PEZI|nr:hypothetical protein QC763_0096750 [Podospora pseudopauciseta]